MDFALTPEQHLFDATLRGYLAEHLPVERLRALTDTGTGFDEPLWQGLCELGLQGLLVPERFGGSGLGVTEAAIMMQEIGHSAGAFAACSAVHINIFGLHAIVKHGSSRQRTA